MEENLGGTQSCNDLLASFTISSNDRVFDKEFLELWVLIDLHDKFALCQPARLINEEAHDCLRHEVCDVFLDDREVAVDQVLDDTGLHNHT